MSLTYRHKFNTSGGVPADTDLIEGEVVLDTANGRAYVKSSDDTVREIGANVGQAATFASLTVTGASSLATLSTSGLATLNSLTVTGASSLATLSTSGLATLNTATVTSTLTSNHGPGFTTQTNGTHFGSASESAVHIQALDSTGGISLSADGSGFAIRQRTNAGVFENDWISFTRNGGMTFAYNGNAVALLGDATLTLLGAASMTVEALGNEATTVTHDFSDGYQGMTVTLTGNAAIANPTNTPSVRCSGVDVFTQDATGSRVPASWGSNIRNEPTLSTDANAVDIVPWYWDGTYKNYGSPIVQGS